MEAGSRVPAKVRYSEPTKLRLPEAITSMLPAALVSGILEQVCVGG